MNIHVARPKRSKRASHCRVIAYLRLPQYGEITLNSELRHQTQQAALQQISTVRVTEKCQYPLFSADTIVLPSRCHHQWNRDEKSLGGLAFLRMQLSSAFA